MNSSFLQLFNPKYELRAGLSVHDGIYHYVLLGRSKKGRVRVLSLRTGPLSSIKIPLSCPVHVDLGNAKTLFIAELIGKGQPEDWIDANENRIIPHGAGSHEILNEWWLNGETLFSCTVMKNAYEKALADIHADSLIFASPSPPLWDLARLYSRRISGPFFIWKLSKRESVLGFVEGGNLCGLCNFWAGTDDVAANRGEIEKELARLAQSLSKSVLCRKIVLFLGNSKTWDMTASEMTFEPPPAIENIPTEYHEAYSLAIHDQTTLDFGETGRVLEAGNFTRSRTKALRMIGKLFASAMVAGVMLLLCKEGSLAARHSIQGKTSLIVANMEKYQAESKRLESLAAVMKEKAGFFGKKSVLAYPLSEMQMAFPEGVWTEELAFSEATRETWNFSLVAYSNASGPIPKLLANLSAIKGMEKIRMVYSEQVPAEKKTAEQRAIKFRVEGVFDKGKAEREAP